MGGKKVKRHSHHLTISPASCTHAPALYSAYCSKQLSTLVHFGKNLESSQCERDWKHRAEFLAAAAWHPISKAAKERAMAHKTHDTQHGLQARAYLLQIRSRASLVLLSLADSAVQTHHETLAWQPGSLSWNKPWGPGNAPREPLHKPGFSAARSLIGTAHDYVLFSSTTAMAQRSMRWTQAYQGAGMASISRLTRLRCDAVMPASPARCARCLMTGRGRSQECSAAIGQKGAVLRITAEAPGHHYRSGLPSNGEICGTPLLGLSNYYLNVLGFLGYYHGVKPLG
ncbi:hypothetical protein TRIATDRAFT_273285 [Trichoderma atroviride IMI 206040]|uniref:Uncharacterized protein n=1 Tax=Hypocrea atroviridis (strain ATCC 20476 / IMI 206040) TaxID=452589 RepID=G9NSL8_HYPAI|nr:uncharacterized protein TRIATDRAFT_273285 [Trichoderma atroviride IMI 206040]EHK46415.1 hypothetical protein TRIATDRAFT_273285 [Trichoderma atroviride IMI 206040]